MTNNVRSWLALYLRLSASRGYMIGFKFGGSLMIVILDTLASDDFMLVQSSNPRDGLKLRMHVDQKRRTEWNNERGAVYAMDWQEFNEKAAQAGQKIGQYFETVCANVFGGQISNGAKRFDKSGDVTINGVEYQCKLDSASATTLQAIENAFHDRHN